MARVKNLSYVGIAISMLKVEIVGESDGGEFYIQKISKKIL